MKLLTIVAFLCSIAAAQTRTQVDYPSQVKNGPLLSDTAVSTVNLQPNCAAAAAAGVSLSIAARWVNVHTMTCAANLVFNGGSIQPASGETVTFTGTVTAPLLQIFDPSGGGHFALAGKNIAIYPEWFGAAGNFTHDDTVALQAASDAAFASTPTPSTWNDEQNTWSTRSLSLTGNAHGSAYRITGTLNMHGSNYLKCDASAGVQIVVDANTSTDGLSWSSGSAYANSGGMDGCTLVAKTYRSTVRDLVVLHNVAGFRFSNNWITGAGRYGVNVSGSIKVSWSGDTITKSHDAEIFTDSPAADLAFTATNLDVESTTNGPCLDLAVLDFTMNGGVIESCGSVDATSGYGARVRSGQATFNGVNFENVGNDNVKVGTDSMSPANVTIINPSFRAGPATTSTLACVSADYTNSLVITGGDCSALNHSIIVTSNTHRAFVSAMKLVPDMERTGGSVCADLDGLVNYTRGSDGINILCGKSLLLSSITPFNVTSTAITTDETMSTLYRKTASPADNQNALVNFDYNNSAIVQKTFAQIAMGVANHNAGSEQGVLSFKAAFNGALQNLLLIKGGAEVRLNPDNVAGFNLTAFGLPSSAGGKLPLCIDTVSHIVSIGPMAGCN